jgi:hypothetical protein
LINDPRLTCTVVAVGESEVSPVDVLSANNIEALLAVVLDVAVGSIVPSDLLESFFLPWSNDSGSVDVVSLTKLVSQDVVLSVVSSDSLSSVIKVEPLLLVFWVVVLDSESVLVTTDVFSPGDSSVACHLALELELDAIGKWIRWVFNTDSVHVPAHSSTISALTPKGVSVLVIVTTTDIKAVVTVVSDVSVVTGEESHLLVVFLFPWSNNSSVVWSGEPVVQLD